MARQGEGACLKACAGDEAGAVLTVGGVALVADERPDVVGNRAVAAYAGDPVAVSRVFP